MYKLNTYTKHVFAVCPRHDYSRLFVLKLERKKSQAVFTDNHMNIDKKNHPQLFRREQPFIWPMVIQIGLGTGMYVSTYSVLFRFGIFVSLNCIPFQFLCTFHFVSFRFAAVNFVTFRFGKFRYVSFCFIPFRYISFRVSFRILQVPKNSNRESLGCLFWKCNLWLVDI